MHLLDKFGGWGLPHLFCFYSAEYTTDVTKRPKLEITYSVPSLVSYTYDALGRLSTATYGNGTVETSTYDTNRLWLKDKTYVNTGIQKLKVENYAIDAAGNITTQKIYRFNETTRTATIGYDGLYRMTSYAITGQSSQSYTYDPNGNFLTYTGKSPSYSGANNRMTGDGSRT